MELEINKFFLEETVKFKKVLTDLKKISDQFDKNIVTDNKEQIRFIEEIANKYFTLFDAYFFKIWDIYLTLPKDKQKIHQKYLQDELVPFFILSPYNRRVYEKPLGYAGDYIMMKYIYENQLEGETTFAKIIHKYSMRIPTAIANRNRKNFYKSQIANVFKTIKKPRITSIASGPAIEIVEFLRESNFSDIGEFICLDFEKEALDYVSTQIENLEKTTNKIYKIKFINSDIMSFIKNKDIQQYIANQDLIYSSGLIDYFSDKVAYLIIKNLFGLLNNNGLLIVGNVSDKDNFRAYTELLGEWYIIHRSEKEMSTLAEKLPNASFSIEYEKETQNNIFLIIRKLC